MEEKKQNWFAKHKVLTIIGAVILLFVIVGALSGGSSTSNNNTADNGDESSSQSSEEVKTEYMVGETASFDNKSITVTNVERNYSTGNQFAQPESGKEFVIVTVDIVNNSDSTLDYNTYEFKMQDSNGVQQNESLMALSEGKLNSGSLAKGGKVTGKLAYEVPQGDMGLKLLYQNFSLFDNKTITFNLQ